MVVEFDEGYYFFFRGVNVVESEVFCKFWIFVFDAFVVGAGVNEDVVLKEGYGLTVVFYEVLVGREVNLWYCYFLAHGV